MNTHHNIRIWNIQDRRGPGRSKPWIVRWQVGTANFNKTFAARRQADNYRSDLVTAHRRGEDFNPINGEPTTWQKKQGDISVHEWTKKWIAENWDEWQPRTRRTNVDVLSRFVPLTVRSETPGQDDELRKYLTESLPMSSNSVDPTVEKRLASATYRLSELTKSILAEVDHQLGYGLQGQPLALNTSNRYRTVAKSCIKRAYELDIISTNPWPPMPKGASRRKVRKKKQIDVRVLPDPATMRQLLEAIKTANPQSEKYCVMSSVMYYAGLRPSEAVMLRPRALYLPAEGWGHIDVVEADIDFDEPGDPKTGNRTVPIPPVLVEMLNGWTRRGAYKPSSHIFRTRNDNRPTQSNWGRAWHRATKSQGHSPLRVYDCRHAAATTWLGAGVPLGEVARRMGHTVETLVSVYVGALQGDEVSANALIDDVIAVSVPNR